MKYTFLTVLLIVTLVTVAYFLGKRNGTAQTKINFVQNIEMVREIAEMSSLEVSGTQKVVFSNADKTNDYFSRMKNYFFENTLEVVVPYKAKYGISLSDTSYSVKQVKKDSVIIQLPVCKLLSLQLELDQLSTMNQAGLFNFASMEDLKKAQTELYKKAQSSLTANTELKLRAQKNIENILTKYYQAVGIKAGFNFK